MRTFFILMVLANLGYFGWRYYTGELQALDAALNPPAFSPAVPQPEPVPEAKSLVLVSELPESARLAAEISAGTPAVTARSGEEATTAQATGQAQDAGNTGQDAAPSVAEPAVTAQTPAPAQPEPALLSPPLQCAMVAGLEQQADADELVNLLAAVEIDSQVQSRQTQTGSTWWVYLPAFATDDLTRRMLAELQEKGIDSYYMRTGELAGGISLGVYSREASARTAQQSLSQRGYSADVRQIFRMGTLYDVVAQAAPVRLQEVNEVAGFLAAHGGATVSEFVCAGVAEPNQLP